MDEVKVRKVGNSLGVTLTSQCRRMGIAEGDTLYVVRPSMASNCAKKTRFSRGF